jgi:hypothetical protein
MINDENKTRNLVSENAGARQNVTKTKKDGFSKGVLITAIISFAVLIIAGIIVYSLYSKEHTKQLTLMESQRRSFTEQLTTRDSVLNEWMLTFDQIEKNLTTIKEKENLINIKSSNVEFTKDKKQQILEDIKSINTLLDQNKAKIAALNAQLKSSGGTIKVLQNKIAELETTMKQRENEVSELKTALVNKDFEIGQLNTRMTGLQDTITQKDTKIVNQTKRLNKAFLARGTYKALKEKGLVSKEGGFLGLGRTEYLHNDFKDSSFEQINITEMKTIPVNSKAVKLITDHPANSYKLVRDNSNKISYIEINDPDEFWKISKYAVVEIGK